MTSRQLWIIRHGATEWALQGRHTGSTDLPLLPQGEEEAKALAPVLKGVRFAAVLSSPLQRAMRTCALAELDMHAEILPELIEWNYGNYEGITTAEIRQTLPEWSLWSHGCPQGEDAAAVTRRCKAMIDQVMAIDGDVALFAHGHILRSLAGTWIGLGAVGGKHLILGTATTSVLGFERENRALKRWNAPCR